MKIVKTLSFAQITGLFILLVIIGCDSSDNVKSVDPFATANFNPYNQDLGERIKAYNNAITNNANSKTGNPALYIDFSSGINKAFNEPGIKAMMADCFNTVLAQNFDVFKLGSHTITALNVTNTTELGQQINDATAYKDIWAPIQAAVEKIVEANNDALLITDFEEWQENKEVTTTAFLKIPFSKWIEKGNTIYFFIADYKEGAVDKHLYFTIFNYGNPSASSMISKLESKLSPLGIRFDLTNKSYKLRNIYPTAKSGGIFYDQNGKSDKAKNILDLKSNYVNGLNNGNYFEFYPFGIDWQNIDKLHAAYKNQHEFNDFFRKLFIDLSNEDSYTFGDFDVKVSDVSSDFENFAKDEEAKSHKPKLAKGNNGEAKFANDETDVIAKTCYDTNGRLKEEYIYKPQPSITINDVFILNKTLFTNTKASDKKNVEFAVSFDPKFNVKSIPNQDGLVKVDILLNIATPNSGDEKLSKFKWINAKKVNNNALYESIKLTLQDLKPVNKVIYSYYIKTQQ